VYNIKMMRVCMYNIKKEKERGREGCVYLYVCVSMCEFVGVCACVCVYVCDATRAAITALDDVSGYTHT